MRPLHIRDGSTPTFDAFGVEVRVIVPAAHTDGSLGLFEEITPPQVGPPLHRHHQEDEFFRVIEGRYRFRAGDEDVEAGPGDSLLVPRGTPHCFINVGDTPGRLFMGLTPGGFEGFFARVAAEKLRLPDDMPRIAAIAADFNLEFLGPNPFWPA
ncbi:MAG: cupin domain-containing protein [Candidatus Krumholzibacteriia bacterium]